MTIIFSLLKNLKICSIIIIGSHYIKLRPFKSLEDLVRVNGIGNIRVQDIINEGKAFIE